MTTERPETWREFERLAEIIMAELQPDATVKWNDYIDGHESEIKRQIDVSIRATSDAGEILTLVQCKDWDTPADVNAVGEFASVIRDVRATKGILVCRSGFTDAAKTYARNLGIDAVNLRDAQSRKWKLDLSIPILWLEQMPALQFEAYPRFLPGDVKVLQDERGVFYLSSDGGKSIIDVIGTFEKAWNEGNVPRRPGRVHSKEFTGPYQILVADESGNGHWRELRSWRLSHTVTQRSWLGYFTPEECRGVLKYGENQSFEVSYLPSGEIPNLRDDGWGEINDPEEVAVTLRGTFVTTVGFQVEEGSGKATEAYARFRE